MLLAEPQEVGLVDRDSALLTARPVGPTAMLRGTGLTRTGRDQRHLQAPYRAIHDE